jgi:hypothetical protein
VDLLEDHRGRAQRQAGAAVFLRDQRAEEAGLGERRDELGRVGLAFFQVAPIGAGESLADAAHRLADFNVVLAEGERDGVALCRTNCNVVHGI